MIRKKLVLASQSPRRRELMTFLDLPFEVVSPIGEEKLNDDLSITEQIQSIALDKAKSVFAMKPNNIVIGADTVVVIDGEILGKPMSPEKAYNMLKKLSGRVHTAYTSVAMLSSEQEICFTSETTVSFYELDDEMINHYIATKEPLDKAGAYTIQGKGALFIKEIKGDFYTVMGLPIGEINQKLKDYTW